MPYWPAYEQHNAVITGALRVIHADHYSDPSNPHEDAEREYASEQLALAARDLTRAVDAKNPDDQPIGWDQPPAPGQGRPERVVICGSTRYTADMAAIEQLLIWRGIAVFAPTACDLKSPNPLWDDPAERDAGAKRLADLHAAMIRDAHWVLVVGPYAGDSTRGEIAHSRALGKTVKFTDAGLAAEFGGEVWDPAGVGQATA